MGNQAPGTNGSFSLFRNLVFNEVGQTAFNGLLTGPEIIGNNRDGIWLEKNGSLALLARTGDEAPGISVSFTGLGNPVLNDREQIAFAGSLTGSGITGNKDIWSEGGSSLALVAQEGNQAPGTDVNFSGFGSPVFNNAGKTAFRGGLTGPGINNRNSVGIWSEENGSLALVARMGSIAPGTAEELSSLGDPIINDAGRIVFSGALTNSGESARRSSGIWSEKDGSLSLVAHQGDEAPGTNGSFFGSLFDIRKTD